MSSDVISLRGVEVFAHHGVYESEQADGQLFLVDVDIAVDLSEAGESDELGTTLDYGALATAIHDRVAGERWDLIEKVAQRVADLVLDDGRVRHVTVTIHKPHAPISVPFDDVAVTIHRSRG